MPMITISFNYPSAPLPRYKFGARVAVTSDCPPCEWLTGKVVGLTLNENQQPYWWYYSVKLDAPSGLTEEYGGDSLVPENQIHSLQLEWEKENCNCALDRKPPPRFQSGTLVKFNEEIGFKLLGEVAEVIGSRYVSGDDWSGWVYKLTSGDSNKVIEIGELLLLPVASITEADGSQGLAEKERG